MSAHPVHGDLPTEAGRPAAPESNAAGPGGIDPRGPRFTAGITTVVLALSLLLGSWLPLMVQALVFALGVTLGLARQPYAIAFRWLVRPRLGLPAHLEDPAAPRSARPAAWHSPWWGCSAMPWGGPGLPSARPAWRWPPPSSTRPSTSGVGCEIYLRIQRLRG